MTKNYLYYIIFMMSIITIIAFILNLLVLVPPTTDKVFLPHDQIVSVAVYHNDQPYILNFQQQKTLITLLNQANQKNDIDVSELDEDNLKDKINKISIQRFKKNEIVLIPMGLLKSKLVWSFEDGTQKLYLVENEENSFLDLLENSYDN